jgi:hypothetical protein
VGFTCDYQYHQRVLLKQYDVIIIGAGAAGLMCAAQAAKRGRSVAILDKASKAGKKILISGGGKCNFTNLFIEPEAYVSNNPHFCKSALSRYTQWDFIALLESHHLSWTEKTLGQLFCDQKSGAVLRMLLDEGEQVDIILACEIGQIEFDSNYTIQSNQGGFKAESLVVATGGPSIPKMGASDFGLQIAKQFGLKSVAFKPGLVPFTFHQYDIDKYFKDLSGLSLEAVVSCNHANFREQLLITHRGLSGPAILQISSYWSKGDYIIIDLLPDLDASEYLLNKQQQRGKAELKTILAEFFPKRLAERLANTLSAKALADMTLGEIKQHDLKAFGYCLNHWMLTPSGTEGLRTAEVCTGGIATNELSSKTLESSKQPGLYFIGETVDVTGWLGGYNFQWAWSSGWACGQAL